MPKEKQALKNWMAAIFISVLMAVCGYFFLQALANLADTDQLDVGLRLEVKHARER